MKLCSLFLVSGIVLAQNNELKAGKNSLREGRDLQKGVLPEEGDLGIRFNKFKSTDESVPLPVLGTRQYPVGGDVAKFLKKWTTAVSVVTRDDFELEGYDVPDYLAAIGTKPTYPNEDPSHPFWAEFRAVVRAQEHRLRNGNVEEVMVLPELWAGYSIADVAEAVHNEYPGLHQSRLLESFFKEGVEIDYDVLPYRSVVDFLGGPLRMAELNTWACGWVGPVNFRAKWFRGRPRPEEVAWLITTGEIDSSHLPADVYNSVMAMNLQSENQFTAYTEGSPGHPAWPAMHSAMSTSSFWMNVVFNLTPKQYCQALLTDYAVAYGRTVAGVHYETDNIDGLNIGQMVVADGLARRLADRYGSDYAAVQAKVKAARFDWNTFNPLDCQ